MHNHSGYYSYWTWSWALCLALRFVITFALVFAVSQAAARGFDAAVAVKQYVQGTRAAAVLDDTCTVSAATAATARECATDAAPTGASTSRSKKSRTHHRRKNKAAVCDRSLSPVPANAATSRASDLELLAALKVLSRERIQQPVTMAATGAEVGSDDTDGDAAEWYTVSKSGRSRIASTHGDNCSSATVSMRTRDRAGTASTSVATVKLTTTISTSTCRAAAAGKTTNSMTKPNPELDVQLPTLSAAKLTDAVQAATRLRSPSHQSQSSTSSLDSVSGSTWSELLRWTAVAAGETESESEASASDQSLISDESSGASDAEADKVCKRTDVQPSISVPTASSSSPDHTPLMPLSPRLGTFGRAPSAARSAAEASAEPAGGRFRPLLASLAVGSPSLFSRGHPLHGPADTPSSRVHRGSNDRTLPSLEVYSQYAPWPRVTAGVPPAVPLASSALLTMSAQDYEEYEDLIEQVLAAPELDDRSLPGSFADTANHQHQLHQQHSRPLHPHHQHSALFGLHCLFPVPLASRFDSAPLSASSPPASYVLFDACTGSRPAIIDDFEERHGWRQRRVGNDPTGLDASSLWLDTGTVGAHAWRRHPQL